MLTPSLSKKYKREKSVGCENNSEWNEKTDKKEKTESSAGFKKADFFKGYGLGGFGALDNTQSIGSLCHLPAQKSHS